MLAHILFFFWIIYPLLFSSDRFHKLETSCHFIEVDSLDNFKTDEKIPLLLLLLLIFPSWYYRPSQAVGKLCQELHTHTVGRGPDPKGFINHSAGTQPGLEVSNTPHVIQYLVQFLLSRTVKGLKDQLKGKIEKGVISCS